MASASQSLILAFTRCNAPAAADEWAAWLDDDYLPLLAGAASCQITHWELTQKPVPGMPSIGFSHVTLLETPSEGVDDLLACHDALERAGRMHAAHSMIELDVLESHGRWNRKAPPSPRLRGQILAYVACNRPQRADEWNRWYEDTHVPDMLESGAFAAATRWRRREPARYRANDLTLYDVSDRPVEEAVELSAAVMPGIVAAGRKLDCHVGALTVTLRPSGRHGGAGVAPSGARAT
jgi:hypothetical protein